MAVPGAVVLVLRWRQYCRAALRNDDAVASDRKREDFHEAFGSEILKNE
jgi:hypothetical protein